MKNRLILSLVMGYSLLSAAAIDLTSLGLADQCEKVKRSSLDLEARSLDVVCDVAAPAALLDYRKRPEAIVVHEKDFQKRNGYIFSSLYSNFTVIDGANWEGLEYAEYQVAGKTIGYRGMVTASHKDLRVIYGAYFTAKKDGSVGKLAKVFVIDRSEVQAVKAPADLAAMVKIFNARVRSKKDQGLWSLTAETVRLPGKDLEYASADILLDLNSRLSGSAIYGLRFASLEQIADPAALFGISPAKGEAAAFCENLIHEGQPLAEQNLEEDATAYATVCAKLTNELIQAIGKTTKASRWLLHASMDEEEKGYLLIPSREKNSGDYYLKVYFDISHNE